MATPTSPSPSRLSVEELLAEMAADGAGAAPKLPALSDHSERIEERVQAWQEGREPSKPAGTYKGIKKIRYSHEDCIDRILTNPGIKQKELADIYGVTSTWMGIVINCDAFKAALAARRDELIDPALAASLNERFGALAARSVEVLLEKLDQPVDKISDKLALEAASLGARALGVGAPPPTPSAADHLANLAHRLIDLNRPLPQIVSERPALEG